MQREGETALPFSSIENVRCHGNCIEKGARTVRRTWLLNAALVALMSLGIALPGWAASPKMKMTTIPAPGIAMPDKVESRLGTLRFFEGFPDKATAEKIYDNLDFQRAVQAYLLAIPAVSQAYNRNEILKLGPANTTVPIFENRMDSKSVFLHPNTETPTAGCGSTCAAARWCSRPRRRCWAP